MFAATKGRDLLVEGGRQFGRAVRLVGTTGPTVEAAEAIRTSVRALRSAMNWLEDTDDFEVAHQRIDAAGAFRREHFRDQCLLAHSDTGYAQECPVALAHNRVGMSIGYVVRSAECSICGQDPEDCIHIVGRAYNGEHCFRIIKQFDLLEVSLVGRPAQPDARIESISVSNSEIREKLGSAFEPGVPVTCDMCLTPCPGVSRPFEGSGHGMPQFI